MLPYADRHPPAWRWSAAGVPRVRRPATARLARARGAPIELPDRSPASAANLLLTTGLALPDAPRCCPALFAELGGRSVRPWRSSWAAGTPPACRRTWWRPAMQHAARIVFGGEFPFIAITEAPNRILWNCSSADAQLAYIQHDLFRRERALQSTPWSMAGRGAAPT